MPLRILPTAPTAHTGDTRSKGLARTHERPGLSEATHRHPALSYQKATIMEPKSIHPDEIRSFAEPDPPDAPEGPPNVTLMFALGLLLLLGALVLRAFLFEPPSPVQALPTATTPHIEEQAANLTVGEVLPPLDDQAVDDQADGPTADAQPLPATLPAGAVQGDLSLTVYQGWPWRFGGRSGEHCMIEVWEEGRGPRQQVWIMCVLLGL